jgi:predicted metal-dependent TIM-barrel fold hydrolase
MAMMISSEPEFVDSHVHLDHIQADCPEALSWFRDRQCLPVSWAYAMKAADRADLTAYLRRHQDTIHEINGSGLSCRYLTGIHPRNITPDVKPEHVRDMILPYLDDDLCIGVGEIGLETGSEQEKEIFHAHLQMAPEVGMRHKIFGLHTPRKHKPEITRAILLELNGYGSFRGGIVIDHCTEATIGPIVEQGFWAGVTLSPIKTSFGEMDRILKHHWAHLDRIMLNTDSGTEWYDDLHRLRFRDLWPEDIRRRLLRDNALRFYGLDRE